MTLETKFTARFVEILRDLADRVEKREVEVRDMRMHTPVAQFAPPGATMYDNIHNGVFEATLELTWEDKKAVDAFWAKVNQYDGLLPTRTV